MTTAKPDDTTPVSPLDSMTTITGESLVGALLALDEKLADKAYKPVSMGGRTFTDISPAYSLEEISGHFGPLGVGWGYEIADEHTADHATKDGKHYLGVTIRLRIWYRYLLAGKLANERVEWDAYGGNANAGSGADEHFSWQGALTNAIGKGWSLQGFQRTIYKGEDFAPDKTSDDAPPARKPSTPQPSPSSTPHDTPTTPPTGSGTKDVLGLLDMAAEAGADKKKYLEAVKAKYGTSLLKDLSAEQKAEVADNLRAYLASKGDPVAEALGAEPVAEPVPSGEAAEAATIAAEAADPTAPEIDF